METHVLAKFDHSGDIAYLIQELKDPMPRLMKLMPTLSLLKKDYGIDNTVKVSKLSADNQEVVKELQELLSTERKAFVARKGTLQSNYSKLFGLLWGQCTPSLQQELRNLSQYKDSYEKRDCLWLLQELQKSASGSDTTQHEVLTYIRAIRTLFTIRQRDSETIQDMSDRLDSQLNSLKLIGGDLHPKYLVDAYKAKNPNKSKQDAKEAVEEKVLTILTIEGANDGKHGALKRHLANQMVHGVDVYPKRRPQAHTLLAKYMPTDKPSNTKRDGTNSKGGNKNTQQKDDQQDTDRVNVTFHQRDIVPIEGPLYLEPTEMSIPKLCVSIVAVLVILAQIVQTPLPDFKASSATLLCNNNKPGVLSSKKLCC